MERFWNDLLDPDFHITVTCSPPNLPSPRRGEVLPPFYPLRRSPSVHSKHVQEGLARAMHARQSLIPLGLPTRGPLHRRPFDVDGARVEWTGK